MLLREEGEGDLRVGIKEGLDGGGHVGLPTSEHMQHRRAGHPDRTELDELRDDERLPQLVQLPRHAGKRDDTHRARPSVDGEIDRERGRGAHRRMHPCAEGRERLPAVGGREGPTDGGEAQTDLLLHVLAQLELDPGGARERIARQIVRRRPESSTDDDDVDPFGEPAQCVDELDHDVASSEVMHDGDPALAQPSADPRRVRVRQVAQQQLAPDGEDRRAQRAGLWDRCAHGVVVAVLEEGPADPAVTRRRTLRT